MTNIPTPLPESEIGIHGDSCLHCLGGKCECLCKTCRPTPPKEKEGLEAIDELLKIVVVNEGHRSMILGCISKLIQEAEDMAFERGIRQGMKLQEKVSSTLTKQS